MIKNSAILPDICLYKILYIYLRVNFDVMKVTTISEFRSNARSYIDGVIQDNSALIINRGNTAAVLISLEEYDSIKATQSVLSSSSLSEDMDYSIEQLSRGEAVEVDIDLL